MVSVYLGVGSNLGNRRENIKKAVALLAGIPGIKLSKISSLYDTLPVGGPKQRNFLNGAIKIKTNLSPLRLLGYLKGIEKNLGRKKTVKNGPRQIDLDILFYGNTLINTKELRIPHPYMFKRDFVLKPLKEII
jgi:2-amino-4-hydroxy-6-hydroxymethyldihydropteridine diphosphokinase